MNKVAKHIVFSGSVQGIGFRFTAQNIANRNMLTGYVRNLSDGTVEMFAQGDIEDIEDAISDLKETFASNIRDVAVKNAAVDPKFREFKLTF